MSEGVGKDLSFRGLVTHRKSQSVAHYDVGYGRPPTTHRFKKGQSGNAKGRTKGSQNKPIKSNGDKLYKIIMEEAFRDIKIQEGGKELTVPIIKAVMRSLSVSALKGQVKAQRLLLQMVDKVEAHNYKIHQDLLNSLKTYKYSWEEEIELCKNSGREPPEVIPHPDHIIIDPRTGNISIKGPMTREEKENWDALIRIKELCAIEIMGRKQLREEAQNAGDRRARTREIQKLETLISRIDQAINCYNFTIVDPS